MLLISCLNNMKTFTASSWSCLLCFAMPECSLAVLGFYFWWAAESMDELFRYGFGWVHVLMELIDGDGY